MQPSYASLGLGTISADQSSAVVIKGLQDKLLTKLTAQWTASGYPAFTHTENRGVMGPWDNSQTNTAPACLVQELTSNFSDWGIPTDPNAINQIAKAITEGVGDNGNLGGTFLGTSSISPSEGIDWGVGYATGDVASGSEGTPPTLGVIFVFIAMLDFSI
jgi:hypothetical protein